MAGSLQHVSYLVSKAVDALVEPGEEFRSRMGGDSTCDLAAPARHGFILQSGRVYIGWSGPASGNWRTACVGVAGHAV